MDEFRDPVDVALEAGDDYRQQRYEQDHCAEIDAQERFTGYTRVELAGAAKDFYDDADIDRAEMEGDWP